MSIFDGDVSPLRFANGMIVGYVDEVNGPRSQPSGIVVTLHELEVVARHWIEKRLENAWWFFISGQSGSTEWRENIYSNQRINMFEVVLGAQRIEELREDVEAQFRKRIDAESWRVFTKGTEEERDAVWEQQRRDFFAFDNALFELRIEFPDQPLALDVVSYLVGHCQFLSGWPDTGPHGVLCRFATIEEAQTMADRLAAVQIRGAHIEVRQRHPDEVKEVDVEPLGEADL